MKTKNIDNYIFYIINIFNQIKIDKLIKSFFNSILGVKNFLEASKALYYSKTYIKWWHLTKEIYIPCGGSNRIALNGNHVRRLIWFPSNVSSRNSYHSMLCISKRNIRNPFIASFLKNHKLESYLGAKLAPAGSLNEWTNLDIRMYYLLWFLSHDYD